MTEWLTWLVVLLIVGVAAAPLTAVLLPQFTAAGYAFAKPFGVLLLGFVYWIGVTAGVLPNSRIGVIIALLVVAGLAVGVARLRDWRDIRAIRDRADFALNVEALFVAAFGAAALLRAFVPEIRDTEKPMEIGFLTSILRADSFPPEDPWLGGEPISYYYFGFVQLAAVTKLAGTAPEIAFNLGLASIAALSVVAVLGLGYELVVRTLRAPEGEPRPRRASWRPWAFGLGAVGLALVIGNLEGALEFGAAHGWGPDGFYRRWDIDGLDLPASTGHWYPDEFFWWWRATRVIPGTITEFPFFSFMLGDLHPHVMAIPARFVFLAFVASLLMGDGPRPDASAWMSRAAVPLLFLVAVLLGSFGFLFTWDLPTMTALLALAVYLRVARETEGTVDPVADGIVYTAIPLVLGVALFLPFWLSIDNPGWGPKVVLDEPTRPDHAFLVWGPLGVIVAAFVGAALARGDRTVLRDARALAVAVAAPAAILVVWAIWAAAAHGGDALVDELGDRGSGWITDAVLATLVAATVLAIVQRMRASRIGEEPSGEGSVLFALVAGLAGALLLLGVDFFYIDDILQRRLNSVFKLAFQAWLLLAIAAAFGLHYLSRDITPKVGERWSSLLRPGTAGAAALMAGTALVLAGALVYPISATFARTDGFDGTPTLDGLAWLREQYPGEYDAQMWLRANSDPDDLVLEAYGDAYTQAGRVSTRSGTPTLLGWWIHEINWRGDLPVFGRRADDMERLYRSADLAEIETLVDDYGIDWVYVGDLEAQRYPEADLTKFARIMDVAYEGDGVVIYRARRPGDGR